jgi:hypothetical protein
MIIARFFLRPEFCPDPPILELELHESYGSTALAAHTVLELEFAHQGEDVAIVDAFGEHWPLAVGSLSFFVTLQR